jgi:hypothetical protein
MGRRGMKTKQLLLVSTICAGICATTNAVAAESPLKCKLQRAANQQVMIAVNCTVVEDKVIITQVQLNRGRCKSPVLDEKEMDDAWMTINSDAEKAKLVETVLKQNGIMTDAQSTASIISLAMDWNIVNSEATLPETQTHSSAVQEMFIQAKKDLPVQELLNDPSNRVGPDRNPIPYHFGDRLGFATFCSNLIEYTIEANGKSWTFSDQ